ncbi:putative DNA-binding protein [uncultured delta proteobacterium]|uniref:Putative DNA-binding protein n=1 Tax=uncultured delta proteobacterium TaxID=34034 RepID=A0A212IY28_9DELT|nr:putative DNA-binding protein [uncultured delta proteobacterium]
MTTMSDPSNSFERQMRRVYAITGARTQVELAALLDIKQSTIANSKKRRNVPDRWLIRLLCRLNVNPDWILTGKGTRYLAVASDAGVGDALGVLRNFPTRALVEELLRRIDTLERDRKILESLGR